MTKEILYDKDYDQPLYEDLSKKLLNADETAEWCISFGKVNNQPEIIRAGNLINLLLERLQTDSNLVGEYSNDANKLWMALKRERAVLEEIKKELEDLKNEFREHYSEALPV